MTLGMNGTVGTILLWKRADAASHERRYNSKNEEDGAVTIELTTDQAHAIAAEGEQVLVVDPLTQQTYRLVREDRYKTAQRLYDDSPWTADEMAILAGRAFGKLDDIDYSEYLKDPS